MKTITEATWDENVVRATLPVLVVFSAAWCGACRQLHPTLLALADQHQGEIVVTSVDTDQDRHLTAAFSVHALPTSILFQDGKEVARTVGSRSAAWFSNWLASHLAVVGDSEPLPDHQL